MRYISTRGQAPVRDFAGVLLTGLAEDGGLFMPESWPRFSAADWRAMRGLSYADLTARVMAPFVGGSIASRRRPAFRFSKALGLLTIKRAALSPR